MTTDDSHIVRDAVRGHWADRYLPVPLRPYARLARLERPIGWWLLLWPCWWSLALASSAAGEAYPSPFYLLLFLIGAVAMRGAGCTYNDIVDRDIDAQVARTKSRPLPSGQVTVRQATLFLVAQAVVGLVVLLQFNTFTVILGLLSLPVIAFYPFMKRITNWPQLILGVAFSWGGLLGWAAVFGRLDLAPVFIYVGGILWTIGYDTIYAHQDFEDDSVIGVRSTARLFGASTRVMLSVLFAGATLLFGAALVATGAGWLAWLGLAGGAAHLAWQVTTLDASNPERCLMLFQSNRHYGWIVFAGLVADGLLAAF